MSQVQGSQVPRSDVSGPELFSGHGYRNKGKTLLEVAGCMCAYPALRIGCLFSHLAKKFDVGVLFPRGKEVLSREGGINAELAGCRAEWMKRVGGIEKSPVPGYAPAPQRTDIIPSGGA